MFQDHKEQGGMQPAWYVAVRRKSRDWEEEEMKERRVNPDAGRSWIVQRKEMEAAVFGVANVWYV